MRNKSAMADFIVLFQHAHGGDPNTFRSTLFSHTSKLLSFLNVSDQISHPEK
jgi:hypothetical protein